MIDTIDFIGTGFFLLNDVGVLVPAFKKGNDYWFESGDSNGEKHSLSGLEERVNEKSFILMRTVTPNFEFSEKEIREESPIKATRYGLPANIIFLSYDITNNLEGKNNIQKIGEESGGIIIKPLPSTLKKYTDFSYTLFVKKDPLLVFVKNIYSLCKSFIDNNLINFRENPDSFYVKDENHILVKMAEVMEDIAYDRKSQIEALHYTGFMLLHSPYHDRWNTYLALAVKHSSILSNLSFDEKNSLRNPSIIKY